MRVSPDVEAFDSCLDGNSEAAKKGLMCSPRGEMKSRPALASVFITDPLK
jgi:hypothetical protein